LAGRIDGDASCRSLVTATVVTACEWRSGAWNGCDRTICFVMVGDVTQPAGGASEQIAFRTPLGSKRVMPVGSQRT